MSSAVGWTFLVLVVLALVAASAWRRRPSAAPPRGPLPPARPDDELGTLGLSPVRPAAPRAAEAAPAARPVAPPPRSVARRADDPADDPEPDDAPSWTFDHDPEEDVPTAAAVADAPQAAPRSERQPEPAEPPRAAGRTPRFGGPLTSVRPAPAAVRPGSPLWDPPGPAEHLLASLAACTGGTIAVLRHDGTHYHVDALAGFDAASWPEPLDAADGAHPLDRAPADRLLSVLDGADLDALTYLAPGTAQAALVRALDEYPEPRVLVAATLDVDADHVDAATARLVGDYVDLLATLRVPPTPSPEADDSADDDIADDFAADDESMPAPDDPEADRAHADDLPAEQAPADEAPADEAPADDEAPDADEEPATPVRRGPEPLPRAVILTGEIQAARAARRDLAFALVTLAHAEALLDGPADAAHTAETALAERLRSAPRVRRVEPFGPLLFGVFLDATPDQVSPWARALSGSGEALCVGAVAPAAGDAESVRALATEALEDAYTQDAVCVVVD